MNPSMEVVELPPYAPELNPVDYVWSYVKHAIVRTTYSNCAKLSRRS